MSYLFVPPVIEEGPMGDNYLFARYRLFKGVTVLKIDNVYYETRFPTTEDIELADIVYMGGHEYPVTAEEKTSLEDAGYEVFTS